MDNEVGATFGLSAEQLDAAIEPGETHHVEIEDGETVGLGDGIQVLCTNASMGNDKVQKLVFEYEGSTGEATVVSGQTQIYEMEGQDHCIVITNHADSVEVTLAAEAAFDAFTRHERELGVVPELAPPAKGDHARPDRPRHLDRSLDYDDSNDMVYLLDGNPMTYAITFPKSDVETYIRARKVDGEFAEDFDGDTEYVAVRKGAADHEFERRDYEIDHFADRMTREPAVRLVHRDDAPDELYPEAYRD